MADPKKKIPTSLEERLDALQEIVHRANNLLMSMSADINDLQRSRAHLGRAIDSAQLDIRKLEASMRDLRAAVVANDLKEPE